MKTHNITKQITLTLCRRPQYYLLCRIYTVSKPQWLSFLPIDSSRIILISNLKIFYLDLVVSFLSLRLDIIKISNFSLILLPLFFGGSLLLGKSEGPECFVIVVRINWITAVKSPRGYLLLTVFPRVSGNLWCTTTRISYISNVSSAAKDWSSLSAM